MAEVALLPGGLPHLLLRAACVTGQTAGELLARVLMPRFSRNACCSGVNDNLPSLHTRMYREGFW